MVALLTGINIFVFLKLKKASEQMMKMAFPGSKNMGDAMAQAQKMMAGMGGGKNMEAQMKAAMGMLSQMQQGGGRPGPRR